MFIFIGLILALVAAGGVFLLTTLLGGGTGIGGGPQTTVMIAKQAIPLRHQITSADLDTLKISSNAAVNAYTSANEITGPGLIAEVTISKGAVITSDMLAKDINLIPSGAAPAYLPLASGWVGMTIPTGELQGVAGHVTVGDYITVIASGPLTLFAPGGPTGTKVVSKTVFIDIRIIGLGPATPNVQPANGATTVGGTTPAGGVVSSLTIEITQCDAEYLTWFLNNMQLKYTLKSFLNYGTTPTAPDSAFCPLTSLVTTTGGPGITNSQVDARYHFTAL